MPPEDLRYEVRRYLYGRPTAAVDAATISHGLARWGHQVTAAEVTAAATFLAGLPEPQARAVRASLGSTTSWQITSAGILAHERNE